MRLITETVTRKYSVDISFNDYREDKNYTFTTQYPLRDRGTQAEVDGDRAEALAVAAKEFPGGATDSRAWSAYRVYETVETVTVETFVENDELFTETSTVVRSGRIATVYRSKEDWDAHVLAPSEEFARQYEESGEKALHEARYAEWEENDRRKEQGLPPVYDAEIAYLTFKGLPVPEYMTQAAVKSPVVGWFKRLVHSK